MTRVGLKKRKKGLNKKLLYSTALISFILLAILLAYYWLFFLHAEYWTAALVDQLSVQKEFTNQTFLADCTSILNSSGFKVAHYAGDDVTVDFYKDLSLVGGKIIVLRAHSAVRENRSWVDLFTSEPYDPAQESTYWAKYGTQLSRAKFFPPYDSTDYWAIGPTFIDVSLRGEFDDSVIILMGCDSLNETSMAEALCRKGAKVVIGWTNWVDLRDTDTSTLKLLRLLLAENPETIRGAVHAINQLNHSYGATLDYYPKNAEIEMYKIPTKKNNVASKLIAGQFQVLPLSSSNGRKRRNPRPYLSET